MKSTTWPASVGWPATPIMFADLRRNAQPAGSFLKRRFWPSIRKRPLATSDAELSLAAAGVQHVRARPHARLAGQAGAHLLEELGAALVVAGGGLGEPGDDPFLDGGRRGVRGAHRAVISRARAATFTDDGRACCSRIRSATRLSATALTDRGKLPVAMVAAVCLLIVV